MYDKLIKNQLAWAWNSKVNALFNEKPKHLLVLMPSYHIHQIALRFVTVAAILSVQREFLTEPRAHLRINEFPN